MPELSLEIDPQEVLRLQGYRQPSDVPTRDVLEILQSGMIEAQQAFQPRWLYQEFRVESVSLSGCRLHDGSELLIREIRERWGRIESLGLAICTIGDAIEERIEALYAEREFPLAYMLDSLGSVAVETLAEGIHRQVCAEHLLRDFKVTSRQSPGYPRWAIEEQRKIFDLLPADTIGVDLNPYCVMTPRKSISFAVGVGPEVRMGSSASPCQSCDMRGCAYRRAGLRQHMMPTWVTEISPLILNSNTS